MSLNLEKLNTQKESIIEILRLIEEKTIRSQMEVIISQKGTRLVCFSVFFTINEDEVKGDVFFEQIGQLKK